MTDSCHQIGEGSTDFELLIALEGAGDLASLAPAAEGGRFWFSYEIFGIVLQTPPFASLAAPELAGDRDAFRLRSSVGELAAHFAAAAEAPIFLCTDDALRFAAFSKKQKMREINSICSNSCSHLHDEQLLRKVSSDLINTALQNSNDKQLCGEKVQVVHYCWDRYT